MCCLLVLPSEGSGLPALGQRQHAGVMNRQVMGSSFMHKEDGRIVETAVEARGGPLGRPVLGVLIVSTVLVIGFFGLIYIGYFA